MNIETLMSTQLSFKVRGNMRNLHPTTMPLWSLIKGLQESRALADLTAQGRALTDPEAFKAWKPRNLMSVYIAVRFRDKTGRPEGENVSGYTGLAGFDFDHVESVEAVMETLKTVPQVVCAGVSASGKGVWCAARVAAANESEYLKCFAEGVRVFKEAGLVGIDIGAHDPTRARFAASSPESWWRWWDADIPAFEPVGDIALLSAPKKNRQRVKTPAGYHTSPELAFDEVRQELQKADEVPDGERNTEKARMCGRVKAIAAKAGVAPDTYAQAFIDKWDSVGSNPKKTRSMVNRLMRSPKNK